jgi:hypothetical protein
MKHSLKKLAFLWETSLYKTFAGKYQTSVREIRRRYRVKDRFGVSAPSKQGMKTILAFRLKDMKKPADVRPGANVDVIPSVYTYIFARTDITHRLAAQRCEYCGKEQGYFEVHHVRKMKDVQGKEPWKKAMLGIRRKTLILCIECHD